MPGKSTVNGPQPLPPWSRRALQRGIAILICLAILDTTASEARALQFCPAGPGTALKAVTSGVPSSLVPLEVVTPQPIVHALRIVSGLVIRTSQQSNTAGVSIATIIGFRG